MSAIIISPAGILPLPVTVSEDHVMTAEISENPIETGASIADHAYNKPRKLTLDVAQAAPQATWLIIKRLMQDRRPFTVVTGLDVYRNMLVKDVSSPRDAQSALIFSGSIQLQEAILVETSRFVVEGQGGGASTNDTAGGASRPSAEKAAPDQTTQSRAAGTVHRGDSPTQDAPTTGTSPEAARNRSILSRVL